MCAQIVRADACNFDVAPNVYARISESGDAAGNASTTARMNVGDTFVGNIADSFDQDWIEIRLVAGTTYDISMVGGTLSDPYLSLYDNSGGLVAYNDDYGYSLDSLITTSVRTTGTYYIEADAYLTHTGSYTVAVTVAGGGGGGGSREGSIDDLALFLTDRFWQGNFESPRSFSQDVIDVNIYNLTADGQRLARWAFDAWERVADISFREVSYGADIDFDDFDSGAYSSSTLSGDRITSSFINISTDWLRSNGTEIDSYSFQTYVHEIGHALGLGHQGLYNGSATYGFDETFSNDSWAMSVMSYFDQDDNSTTPATFARTAGPMIVDIVAIQSLYGAAGAGSASAGNSVYGANSNVGGYLEVMFDAMASGWNSAFFSNNPMTFSIFDAGGIDLIDLSYTRGASHIDLRPEAFSNIPGGVHNMSIARGTVIENLTTGMGNDTIFGNEANNIIRAGDGLDRISTFGGNDVIYAGNGGDTVYSGDGDDVLHGEGGWDQLWSGNGNDLIFGGHGNDAMGGASGNDTIWGGMGNDSIYAGAGDDRLFGEDGNDEIWTGFGNDTVDAGDGDDVIGGYHGHDFLFAGAGNDIVYGGWGHDTLQGGDGNDQLFASHGDDRAFGGRGNDTIYAGRGDDFVQGNQGDDLIYGAAGNDTLNGGYGNDTLSGGPGRDIFVFVAGHDHIVDFNAQGVDRLDLRSFAEIINYTDLRTNHFADQGSDILITGSVGNTVVLAGVSVRDIDASDFIF